MSTKKGDHKYEVDLRALCKFYDATFIPAFARELPVEDQANYTFTILGASQGDTLGDYMRIEEADIDTAGAIQGTIVMFERIREFVVPPENLAPLWGLKATYTAEDLKKSTRDHPVMKDGLTKLPRRLLHELNQAVMDHLWASTRVLDSPTDKDEGAAETVAPK